jgi:hypothetical protein
MLTTVNSIAAYLFFMQGDKMPSAIMDDDKKIDIALDDLAIEAWSNGTDTVSYDFDRLQRFIDETEVLLDNLLSVEIDSSEPAPAQYMTLFYNAAKETFDHDKTQLRTYFAWLYLVIFYRAEGPRWGEFVEIYGASPFVTLVRERFANLT